MKKKYSFIFLLCYSISLLAQIPVGYNHAPNGKPIIGDYHTFLNNEFASLEISLENDFNELEKGVFLLNNSDVANKSYINFLNNKIVTKPDTLIFSKTKKYKAEEIQYFKLGVDSFFVVNHIKIKEKIINAPTIIKHVATFDSVIYAQYYEYNKMNGTLKNKFFVKNDKISKKWEHLKLEGEPVRKFLMNYNKFIDKKELTEEEFLNSIKEIQYFDKYKNEKPLFYDGSWQELKINKNATQTAKVVNKKDSIFTLDYFNNKQEKIFQVLYSSLNPIKKTGKMSIYTNNNLSSERYYSNDSLKGITHFYKNGKVKLKSENKLIKDEFNNEKEETHYLNVINDSDIDIVKTSKGIVSYDDLQVSYGIEKNKITNAYYAEKNNIYYFFNKTKKSVQTKSLKNLLESFLHENILFSKYRLENNLEGTILIDIITDYKGRVASYSVLNKLNNEMDVLIENFLEEKLSKQIDYKFRFKGIRLEDKSAFCRFVLPVSFTHKRFHKTFTRPSYNYWMHDHMMFHQQMMMQQQQQMMRAPGF